MSRAYAASGLLAALLAAVAFLARGGTQLGRTTAAEILLVAVGAALVIAALVSRRRGPVHGAAALVGLGALAAFTALSVGWSVVPDLSFVEAGRSFAYLAVFAGAVAAARLAPTASPLVLRGVLIAAVVICGYALASRVWPGALAQNEFYARLGQPFGYWNAVGAIAALGVVPALWLGARRPGPMLERALAFPACGVLLLALLLTQSCGALAALVIGVIAWFAFVPLRLRSLAVLAVAAVGAAPVAVWALSKEAFTINFVSPAARESVAGEFGLLVVLMIVGLLVAGLAASHGMARVVPSMRLRRRAGLVAVAAVLAVPLALFTSVASSDRGLSGTISDRVGQLTSETAAAPPEGAGRLTVSSSSRARYWREAGDVFDERPGTGTGAGTFYVSRLRYRKDELVAQHAHGYVPQTMSDLGLLGLGVSAALLLAWAAAALRATALLPRLRRRTEPRPPLEWTGERMALLGLAIVALVFGVQSAIDWTWFVPGVTVMALAAAGFVAGRGALAASVAGATAPLGPEPAGSGRLRRPPWPRIAGAVGVVLTGTLLAGAIWQPERSSRANAQALEELEKGDLAGAAKTARDAREADPLSPRPRFAQASIEAAAGRDAMARKTLESTVLAFPGDPQTWLRLAEFELSVGKPRRALEVIRGALYLDPFSKAARRVREQARAAAIAEVRTRTRRAVKRRRD
ncbi:MAG: O-antigen ligase family protein, partial [Actinomycetota bacterium]|nr:O-antigen ligase family protein [Actinomycetota bacterium]